MLFLLCFEFSKGAHVALLHLTLTLPSRGSTNYRGIGQEVGMMSRLLLGEFCLAPAGRPGMHSPGASHADSDGEQP